MPTTSAGVALRESRVMLFLVASAASLIPWTVGLAVTLPRRYEVDTWTLTWTGFDAVLIGCFSVTAWALWKQRQIALPATFATSVLLLSDAWFDMLTAHRGADLLVSAVTAMFGEVPVAIMLAATSTRLLRASIRASRNPSVNEPEGSMWRTPLITSQMSSAPRTSELCDVHRMGSRLSGSGPRAEVRRVLSGRPRLADE
jgi:hypothetical protein